MSADIPDWLTVSNLLPQKCIHSLAEKSENVIQSSLINIIARITETILNGL